MRRILILSALCLTLCACGGGSGSGGNVTEPPAVSTLKGTVTFPSTVAKVAIKDLAAATPSVSVQIYDLKGGLIATADVTAGSTSDTYVYTTSVTISNDAIIKAVRGGQILRAALDSTTLTAAASKDLNVITTTSVVVIEQYLGITAGSLGTSSAPLSPPALTTLAPAILETSILQAVAAASSLATTTFTTTAAAYANWAAIVTAATKNNVDAAQFISGTVSVAISTPITLYSVSSSGTPVLSNLTSDQVASTFPAIISTITRGITSSTNTGSIKVSW